MTDLRKAAEMALEALEPDTWDSKFVAQGKRAAAREALRQALAQPDEVLAERKRIVDLFMIQHEAAKGAHNYWKVAANLAQADVASDT